MDRGYQRLDVHAGGDPPVEPDAGSSDDQEAPGPDLETDYAITADEGLQGHDQTIKWIRYLQKEGFYFQRKNETRGVVDGYRALAKAGTVDHYLLRYIDEIWENAQEDLEDFYAADGGDEAPSQGTSRGRVLGA